MESVETPLNKFQLGDSVHKIEGYRWPGIIVSVFYTIKREQRYVVECISPGVEGALHIYSPKQLEIGL